MHYVNFLIDYLLLLFLLSTKLIQKHYKFAYSYIVIKSYTSMTNLFLKKIIFNV